MTHWFTKNLAPGRHGLGWLSLVILLALVAAAIASQFLGWSSSARWFLADLVWVDSGLMWYARGYNGPLVLIGLFGGGLLMMTLVATLPRG